MDSWKTARSGDTGPTSGLILPPPTCTPLASMPPKLNPKNSSADAMNQLTRGEQGTVEEEVRLLLKQNRYDPAKETLVFTGPEAASYQKQMTNWADYFSRPDLNGGLKKKYISDPGELKQLTSFFAWAAWASVANRPGKSQTYTNNFPYDKLVGNTPSGDAVLWSAISLITLLVGTGLVLFAFGKFDYLGWKGIGPGHPSAHAARHGK